MLYNQTVIDRGVVTPRFLPAPLIQARAEVFNKLNCLDLNQTARRVLYGILTFVNLKKLDKAIFPWRETLRAEAMLGSDATLYRGLAHLERCGYISRCQVRRAWNGKFHVSPILLTAKAQLMLALNDLIHKVPSTKLRDGYVNKELTNKKQSLQNTSTSMDASKKEHRLQNGLPSDLHALLTQGVSKQAICWLMKIASQKKKRLSHVVAAVAPNIRDLRGREVVAYLRAMIAKNIDFEWVANDAKTKLKEHCHADKVQKVLDLIDARFEGVEVITNKHLTVGFVESYSSGECAVVRPEGSLPINRRFAQALVDGRLRLKLHLASSLAQEVHNLIG